MSKKDWIGGITSAYATIGASNHSETERENNDYYATHPDAVEWLLKLESFSKYIWEPACGAGHICKVLAEHGHTVIATNLVYRGCGHGGVDFLARRWATKPVDIITNPPYKYAKEFVQKALESVGTGHKVAMLLKLTFLESKGREQLFKQYPPRVVYVSRKRLKCAKNADWDSIKSSAVAYAWFVWVKGFEGEPVIRWFN